MKRTVCILFIITLMLFLSGCNGTDYPYIKYQHSSFELDADNRKIYVQDGYVLNQAHSYDVTKTNDGYSITLYFVKGGSE